MRLLFVLWNRFTARVDRDVWCIKACSACHCCCALLLQLLLLCFVATVVVVMVVYVVDNKVVANCCYGWSCFGG